jgi:hypothetical protein
MNLLKKGSFQNTIFNGKKDLVHFPIVTQY